MLFQSEYNILIPNSYYVGYAKFFDTTDNTCDSVSWHVWLNLFTREYLTQARRQAMNNLADLMNGALRDAVARAGPQVHFIDYDYYVGMTNGRYCQPNQNENGGNGANRQDLFFYEMKSVDSPWLAQDDWSHDELKRRQNTDNDDGDIQPVNQTLNALYGALMQEAIESDNDLAALQDDNANNDLDAEVSDEEHNTKFRRWAPTLKRNFNYYDGRYLVTRSLNNTNNSTGSANTTHSWSTHLPTSSIRPTPRRNGTNLGISMSVQNSRLLGNHSRPFFSNGTANSSSVGTVVANHTHVLLANGKIVEKVNLKKLIISDKTSRVFHPTQNGHALIANMILYEMSAQNAQSQGERAFTPCLPVSSRAYTMTFKGLAHSRR